MAEYIDKNGLIKALNKFAPEHYNALVNQLITKYPAADVVEVRHGHWIRINNKRTCSECGYYYFSNGVDANYCSECGAKMDGGKRE